LRATLQCARRIGKTLPLLALLLSAPAWGQDELESRLPTLSGAERARALAELTRTYRAENPRKALEYGNEALALLREHPDPRYEAMASSEMAWACMVLGEYETAVDHAERGRDIARAHGDMKGLSQAVNNLGAIAGRRGNGVLAAEMFAQALEIRREHGDEVDIALSLNNLGVVHSFNLADYDGALAYYLEALDTWERLDNKRYLALTLNNIGVIYKQLHVHDEALEYFNRALALRRELGIQHRIASTLSDMGEIYTDLEAYDDALDHQRRALKIRRVIGDKPGTASVLREIAVVQTKLDRLDLAEECLSEALVLADEAGELPVRISVHLSFSTLHRRRRRFGEAEAHAREGLALAQEMATSTKIRDAFFELSFVQEESGQFRSALHSYKQYKELSDTILDEDGLQRFAVLERRFESEKRGQEIEKLKREQAMQAIELNRQKLERNAVAGVTLLLGAVGFLFYRKRVEAARLAEELSTTDSLTGLRNRRYVGQTMEVDAATALRRYRDAAKDGAPPQNADLVFLLVDIDHFKTINDEFGHCSGDRVLVQLSQLLRRTCRATDTVVRWGGEEFLCISRFTDRTLAAKLAERVREQVEKASYELADGKTVRLTCSVGYSAFPFSPTDESSLTWEQVVSLADQAMYAAKRSGRNAWVGISGAPSEDAKSIGSSVTSSIRQWLASGAVAVEASLPVDSIRWQS